MKTNALNLLVALAVSALALPAFAEGDHGHAHKKKESGPNGGRVLTAVEPHLEFLVTKDRKVQITALAKDLKPAALSGQVISVTAGERSNPVKLEFKEEGGKLVSTNTLPEGDGFPVSVSIKADGNAKAVYEKFNLHLSKCPECEKPEYACVCEH